MLWLLYPPDAEMEEITKLFPASIGSSGSLSQLTHY